MELKSKIMQQNAKKNSNIRRLCQVSAVVVLAVKQTCVKKFFK